MRETLAGQAAALGSTRTYDFQAALNALKEGVEPLAPPADDEGSDQVYPLLTADAAADFRANALRDIQAVMRSQFPSLAETDKEELSEA